jgi:hypothetical protein
MTTNNLPSIDPANLGSMPGTLNFVFHKLMQGQFDSMLPAKIISYDRTLNRAQVQPLITILNTNGTQTPRPQYASVPVMVFGGGGVVMSFNLPSGSLGWICANDRDISAFLNDYKQSAPNTNRMFNFSDGVFIPDVMMGYTVAEEDETNASIQTLDGTIKITIGSNGIKIAVPELSGSITLEGNVVVTGLLTANGGLAGSGGAGPNTATLTGNLRVIGDITASGDITPHVP